MTQGRFDFNRSTGFAGPCFDPALDGTRLKRQLGRVYNVMKAGGWWTLRDIAKVSGDPEASVSAQLRHLRKPKFGGYTVDRRRATNGDGMWEYRLQA